MHYKSLSHQWPRRLMQLQGVLASGETHGISEGETNKHHLVLSSNVHLGAPARSPAHPRPPPAGVFFLPIVPHLRYCSEIVSPNYFSRQLHSHAKMQSPLP